VTNYEAFLSLVYASGNVSIATNLLFHLAAERSGKKVSLSEFFCRLSSQYAYWLIVAPIYPKAAAHNLQPQNDYDD
jgi:hypothetical protein